MKDSRILSWISFLEIVDPLLITRSKNSYSFEFPSPITRATGHSLFRPRTYLEDSPPLGEAPLLRSGSPSVFLSSGSVHTDVSVWGWREDLENQ